MANILHFIPKVVRDALGLKAGSELQVEITEEETGERTIALRPGQERALLMLSVENGAFTFRRTRWPNCMRF